MKINQLLIAFFCMQSMSGNSLLAQQSQIPSNQTLQNTTDDSVSTGTQQLFHVIDTGNVNDYQLNEADQKALNADENWRENVEDASIQDTNRTHNWTLEEFEKLSGMEQLELLSQNIRRDDGSNLEVSMNGQSIHSNDDLIKKRDEENISPTLAKNILAHSPEIIKTLVGRLHDENLRKKGSFLKRLLLVGSPGVGKSSIGMAIATECNMPIFRYNAAGLGNSYMRSVVVALKKIFEQAQDLKEPCIIILDEFGALLRAHNNKNETDASALYYLYSCLDKAKKYPILFIATLNDAKEVTNPLKSRFKNGVVNVLLPDEQLRTGLLLYYLQETGKTYEIGESEIITFAKKTKGFTHRDIEDLIELVNYNFSNHHIITVKDINRALQAMYVGDATMNELWYKKLLKMGLQSATVLGFMSLLPWGYSQYQARLMHKESLAQQRQMHAESLRVQTEINASNLKIQKEANLKNHESQRTNFGMSVLGLFLGMYHATGGK